MMKKAIKLLVLAGALLSVGAMADANQTWHFSFPQYAFIYTNVSDVYFDFTNDDQDGDTNITLATSAFDNASLTNLENCINTKVSSISEVTEESSAGTDSIGDCEFARSGLERSGFTVTWNGGDADGALLIVTNGSSYNLGVYSNAKPAGVDFEVAPAKTSSSTTGFVTVGDGQSNSASLGNQGKALPTNYANVYVVPLTFAVKVSPAAVSEATDATYTVTYTVVPQ